MGKRWLIIIFLVSAVLKEGEGATQVVLTLQDILRNELEDLLSEFMDLWVDLRAVDDSQIKISKTVSNDLSSLIKEIRGGNSNAMIDSDHQSSANQSRYTVHMSNEKQVHVSKQQNKNNEIIDEYGYSSSSVSTLFNEKSYVNNSPVEAFSSRSLHGTISHKVRRSVPPSLYIRKKEPKRCMGSGAASVFSGGNALNYMSFLVTVSTLILNINNNINNNNNNNNNNANNNVQNNNVNTNLNSNNANQINVMPPGRRRRKVNEKSAGTAKCSTKISSDMTYAMDMLTKALLLGPTQLKSWNR